MSTRKSVDTGVAALVARQWRGWWRDFYPSGPAGDEYVTAYCGTLLADVGQARTAVEMGWRSLAGRLPFRGPGWGWSLPYPADADSTAFAVWLACALGQGEAPAAAAGREFLRDVTRADGVLTYRGRTSPTALWEQVHDCVTATVCGEDASLTPALAEVVSRTQSQDGSWQGFWWLTPDYPTGVAVMALPASVFPDQITRAAGWVLNRPEEGVGAFQIAWRLHILLKAQLVMDGLEREIDRLVRSLKSSQSPDGLWPGTAIIQLPAGPRPSTSWSFPPTIRDEQGMLTTATAIRGLHRALRAGFE